MELKLWTILVPDRQIEELQRWDAEVVKRVSGLSVTSSILGVWHGQRECMVQVLIACTHEEIKDIAEMTKRYFNQASVMYWLVSHQVEIV